MRQISSDARHATAFNNFYVFEKRQLEFGCQHGALATTPALAQAAADDGIAIRLALGLPAALRFKLVTVAAAASLDALRQGVCRTSDPKHGHDKGQQHRQFCV